MSMQIVLVVVVSIVKMMAISLLTSWVDPSLNPKLGLPKLLSLPPLLTTSRHIAFMSMLMQLSSDNYVSVHTDAMRCKAGNDEAYNTLLMETGGITVRPDLIVIIGSQVTALMSMPTMPMRWIHPMG